MIASDERTERSLLGQPADPDVPGPGVIDVILQQEMAAPHLAEPERRTLYLMT